MKYDDASWHYDGEFPAGLSPKNGATHIGMFVAWLIERDLISRALRADAEKELALVKKRKMTGAAFLIEACDEKLIDEDLSPEGNRFAKAYFQKKYLDDYGDLFGDDVESLYELNDSWHNYDRLRPILDKRWAAFTGAPAPEKKTLSKKKAAAPKKKKAAAAPAKKKAAVRSRSASAASGRAARTKSTRKAKGTSSARRR
jgi:hypothetical protein